MKLAFSTTQYILAGFFAFLFVLACEQKLQEPPTEETVTTPPLFTLLSPQQTGIDFQNLLNEGLNTNILMYEYFYNGGGVASGDFNGDGRIDLYFTSNMGKNKLYLNQGGMKFKDITQASGAGGVEGPWKTGVNLVDINGDNQLDLYLCYSGALPDPKRVNQLFINEGNDEQGIPRFSEKAAEFGLASTAFSNQSYFFDFDRDGDLDMLLLNHNPKSLPVLNEVSTAEFLKQDDPLRGIRLYQQSKGKFRDITVKAGISGSALSYGLGIGITDINDDGWPDFYISNDYTVPDYLYINQKNGTFSNTLNQSMGHNSHFSMGNDIADVNNDGLPDIFTLDMLPEDNRRQKLLMSPDNYSKFDLNLRSGFHYQYMRNMLQLNNGNGTFSEIGQLAGIANTDWSWAALLADYDNDGWKDLFVSNGYKRDYTNLDFIKYMESFVQRKGRLQRTDVLELIKEMPASNVKNYLFANRDGLSFEDMSEAWGILHSSNSNGAAYADLDNDGDLDLVVNNINRIPFIYQNESQKESSNHYLQVQLKGSGMNTQGLGARVEIFYQGKQQVLEQYPTRGYLSAVSPVLHFGLGKADKIDSLIVRWNEGKMTTQTNIPADQVLVLEEKNSKKLRSPFRITQAFFTQSSSPVSPEYTPTNIRDFDRQPLLLFEPSYTGPCIVKADINQDGKEDVLVGGIAGQATSLFLQTSSQSFQKQSVEAFENDIAFQDADIAVFDADQDGNLDLYIASGGYHRLAPQDDLLQDRLYLGDGQGNFQRKPDALPEMKASKSSVTPLDVNEDGAMDLFVGSHMIPGRYPEIPESYLLINDGMGVFKNQVKELAPELETLGRITDALWIDLDLDQKHELIVVGAWMPVTVFGQEEGKLKARTDSYLDASYSGWWNQIAAEDLNGDQKPDLVLGNIGTNTPFQVSEQEPAELYYRDFDNNGSLDPIFCFYIQGQSYPYVTRDELLGQLAYLRPKYTSYESYADARITDIFSEDELEKAEHLSINHQKTSLFLSGSGNRLILQELPVQAQYAPVYTISFSDFDQDGNQDMLLCGNNAHSKLRMGKFDANYGSVFLGDGKGNFAYLPQKDSGLDLRGDVRSVVQLNDTWLFGINNASLVSYTLTQ